MADGKGLCGIDACRLPACQIDPTGVLLVANAAFGQTFGPGGAGPLPALRNRLGEGVWRGQMAQPLDRARAGLFVTARMRLPVAGVAAASATERWFEVSFTPVRDEQGRVSGLVLHFNDIDLLMQHDREIQQARWLENFFLEGTTDLCLRTDTSGRVVTANPIALRLVKIGDSFPPPALGADPREGATAFRALLAAGSGGPHETLLRDRGGAVRALSWRGLVLHDPDLSPHSCFVMGRDRTFHRRADVLAAEVGLTPREREVADIAFRGLGNAAIGQRLNVSEQTIKVHLNTIYRKARVSSRAEFMLLYTQPYPD